MSQACEIKLAESAKKVIRKVAKGKSDFFVHILNNSLMRPTALGPVNAPPTAVMVGTAWLEKHYPVEYLDATFTGEPMEILQ